MFAKLISILLVAVALYNLLNNHDLLFGAGMLMFGTALALAAFNTSKH